MEKATTKDLSRSKRQPLRDANNRINIAPPSARQSHYEPITSSFEKQMKPSDPISSSNGSNSPATVPENKRVSVVIDHHSDSKRNSAVSTTSTNSGRSRRKTHIGPWQLGRTLGKGATSRVRLAKHAVTGQSAAIKIVSKQSAVMAQSDSIAAMDKSIDSAPGSRAIPSGIEREVVIMKLIEHPNVISLYDVWENRGELYLVLEYVEGGELFDYVSERGPLPEIEAVRLFRQIIAALSYCHQFNICHRDLKPENILLDSQRNIKIADFGMAALQPAGHWLNTSCGSPHYASPEIIHGHRYQGNKADIWSCGIILYAMLAGFLPFDGGDLAGTLKLVKKGEYILPPWFSPEAIDLIQRILQKRPENRIRMDEMWLHPLLLKYEAHSIVSDCHLNSGVPPPPLPSKDFKKIVRQRRDIDTEILRSLQTLWHGKRREELIETLLNNEANHEKLFYKALLKFREEQLENYEGLPLEYSSSDYHHVSRPLFRPQKRMPSSHGEGNIWRRSKFSIATNTSGLKEGSNRGPMSAQTIASYDPYRSSQTAIADPKVEYANVTIHRHLPSGFSAAVDSKSTQPVAQRGGNRKSSNMASSPNGCPGTSSRRSSLASFQSRSSAGSYRQRVKPVRVYKRNVSFRQLQSHAANKTGHRSDIPGPYSQHSLSEASRKAPKCQSEGAKRLSSDRFSSPSLPSPPTCVRPAISKVGELEVAAKTRQSYHYWKEEARKVSQELEQICEEAFNSSSLSSSRTIDTGSKYPESPVTSVSSPGNLNGYYSRNITKPLREQTFESSSSYATRELAETRRRLIEHSKQASADGLPTYLSEVIAHLDRLIGSEPTILMTKDATTVKEPVRASQTASSKLPAISEERHSVKDFLTSENDTSYLLSSPAPLKLDDLEEKKTIRVVPDSTNNLGAIRPLTIRKKRTTLELPTPSSQTTSCNQSQRNLGESLVRNRSAAQRNTTGRFYSGLEPIEENPKSPKKSEIRNSGETRKWSWFKHRSQSYEDVGPPTPPKDDIPPRLPSVFNIANDIAQSSERLRTVEGENSKPSKDNQPAEKGKKLLKLFGRKKREKPAHELARGINDPGFSISSLASKGESNNSDPEVRIASNQSDKAELPIFPAPSQNWFMRIFNIKPASKVIALNASKSRARKEVLKILREWKKYGMEDIHFDKQNSVIRGKVGELNFLRLRPVEFSVELFTVLEYGRNVNLSLIRVKQERGAASSFRKVVDTLIVVLKQRKLLVEETSKAKKMAKVLDFTGP
ncbi:serine/threonine-protein kinase gin4 [Emydomyces testavorans]|uniref:non-specific serine/threonine protein kinase n=1 Tax=Emydomyces testavorans TaxID=2070801 RepID=A0AAF0DEK1_9EURO|nr:serine/threonine-protein kinase gin4 [Emydomyces testavorans]